MNTNTEQSSNLDYTIISRIDRLFELLHEDTCINPAQRKTLRQYIDGVLNYHAKVGVFGKTGVGKSTLCNALFGHDVAAVSDVDACTRHPQEILLAMSHGKGISLVDVPGVGEDEERDQEYTELYRHLLPQLDLVLWVIKADDRALSVDLHCYREIIAPLVSEIEIPVVMVLNQADKMPPHTEWDWNICHPGPGQQENLTSKIQSLSQKFNLPETSFCAVSADQNYGLINLMEILIRRLPEEKKWSLARQAKAQNVSKHAWQEAENGLWYSIRRKLIDMLRVLPEALMRRFFR